MRRNAYRTHRRLQRRRQLGFVIIVTMVAAAAMVGMRACSEYYGQETRVGTLLTDRMQA